MSKIDDLLDHFTLIAFGRILQGENRTHYYDQLKAELKKLAESWVPEKRDPYCEGGEITDSAFNDGYNQAHSQISKNITEAFE